MKFLGFSIFIYFWVRKALISSERCCNNKWVIYNSVDQIHTQVKTTILVCYMECQSLSIHEIGILAIRVVQIQMWV